MMRISVITPNYNGERFLAETVRSVLDQRRDGLDVQYIVIDGNSTDGSLDTLRSFGREIDVVVSEPDQGPACAVNKGLALADGDVLAWLNADDRYHPGALWRVADTLRALPSVPFAFGRCRIVDAGGREIRRAITGVKERFFPVSCRFAIQSINYISQPALFFRRRAYEAAGPLREDLVAAWDYEFVLRLWRQGPPAVLGGPPLADFRWRPDSISGAQYVRQFEEEYRAAVADAGSRWLPQSLLHAGVRWGIVGIYRLMAMSGKSDAYRR